MTKLDVFRLSAEACGHSVMDTPIECHIVWDEEGVTEEWNPYTNDSQRWECEKQLLKLLGRHAHIVMNQERLAIRPITPGFCETIVMPYGFPVEKFYATALAELESRKVPK